MISFPHIFLNLKVEFVLDGRKKQDDCAEKRSRLQEICGDMSLCLEILHINRDLLSDCFIGSLFVPFYDRVLEYHGSFGCDGRKMKENRTVGCGFIRRFCRENFNLTKGQNLCENDPIFE